MSEGRNDKHITDERIELDKTKEFSRAEHKVIMRACLKYGKTKNENFQSNHVGDHLNEGRDVNDRISGTRIEEMLGRYGRVAHFSSSIDDPFVEFVGEETSSIQKRVIRILREYATIDSHGSVDLIDVQDVILNEWPEKRNNRMKTAYKLVGRHARALTFQLKTTRTGMKTVNFSQKNVAVTRFSLPI